MDGMSVRVASRLNPLRQAALTNGLPKLIAARVGEQGLRPAPTQLQT